MKKLITICFALCLLMCGITLAQDSMKQDNMKADASAKAVDVTGKISKDGKMFVSDKDSKSWTITNPDAVKGHEGHHVILNAHVYADKKEVHVMSLKLAADRMKNDSMQKSAREVEDRRCLVHPLASAFAGLCCAVQSEAEKYCTGTSSPSRSI